MRVIKTIVNVSPFIKGLVRLGLNTMSLLLGPIVRLIAKTGYGSDICWRQGFLPLPVHYYSPVPDRNRLESFDWNRRADLGCIGFDENSQIVLLKSLSEYASECSWPQEPVVGQYYSSNGSFGYSSACLLYTMIRKFKPAKVIEVGAGFSTHIICQALLNNAKEGKPEHSSMVSIEPYPGAMLQSAKEKFPINILEDFAENIPLAEYQQLKSGDLLFIDSSHVVRIGGDVNYLFLEVLPRLNPGVIIHIHDIYLPYEYPKAYYFGFGKKFFWTEQYLLQAFLSFNTSFKVMLAGYWLQIERSDEFVAAFPGFDSRIHRPTTSFYLRKVQ